MEPYFKLIKFKYSYKDDVNIKYGVIINVKNINYLITNYISNIDKIFIKNEEVSFTGYTKQFLFDITIIKLNNLIIGNKTKFINKINNIKSITIESNEIELDIDIKYIKYELVDAIHPILPKLLNITCNYKLNEDIRSRLYRGNIVYSNNKFIGIIGQIEEDKINIIPSYIILSQLDKPSNNIKNIWNNIDKEGYIYNDKFNNFEDGDQIVKLNNTVVSNGNILIKELNYILPIQTYIYYNFPNKNIIKKVIVNRKSVDVNITCKMYNIDEIFFFPFHQIYEYDQRENLLDISFEHLNNLFNSLGIDEIEQKYDKNIIEQIFENPYNK